MDFLPESLLSNRLNRTVRCAPIMNEVNPFKDIFQLIADMPPADEDKASELKRSLTAISAMVETDHEAQRQAIWYQSWSQAVVPERPTIVVMVTATVGDEDVVEKASQYIDLHNRAGGLASYAATNVGAGLSLFELAPSMPFDPTKGGLGSKMAAGTFAYGMETSALGADLLALTSKSFGAETYLVPLWQKISTGTSFSADDVEDILCHQVGRDIPALMGAMAAARYQRIPVIMEGMAAHIAAYFLSCLHENGASHIASARSPQWFDRYAFSVLAPSEHLVSSGVDCALASKVVGTRISMIQDLSGVLHDSA